jgi:hypothetical protein
MRTILVALVLAIVLGAVRSGSLDAQTIRGRVLDASTDAPVLNARVRLISGTRGVASTSSSQSGDFEILAPHGGTFQLRIERLGFPVTTTPPFPLLPGEVVEVTLRLDPQAILLAPLTVNARTGGERGRDQFERRCALGTGICMDPIEVASIKAEYPSLLFRNVEGLTTTGNGIIRRLGSRCMRTFMNNEPFTITGHTPDYNMPRVGLSGSTNPTRGSLVARMMAGRAGDPHDNNLDKWIPRGAVRAIEIYLNISDVPKEISDGLRGWDLWPDDGIVGRCGAIIIWTWDQW